MAHHRELIAACAVRDADWAASVMRSHIHAAHQVMLRHRTDADRLTEQQ
jgi:DNA-binding FadR family transcriptional regulator